MVVLAASICTKTGKAVVSRQFIDMPRARIEGLLASFPKLIGTAGEQHTFVETENVRYVYQPLDDLFMVLVTNKNSNILQDIDTLQLFARVVADNCRSSTSIDEKSVSRVAFELLSIFDEIITCGYREDVSLTQIRTILEMESHEEKVQAEIDKNKEKEAKEELNRKVRAIDAQKRENAKRGSFTGGNSSGGFSNSSVYNSPSSGIPDYSRQSTSNSRDSHEDNKRGSFSNKPATPVYNPNSRGMKLGGKKTQSNMALFDQLKTEEPYDSNVTQSPTSPQDNIVSQMSPITNVESVHLTIEEKITVIALRDGGIENMEVKGDMVLKVSDPNKAHLKLAMDLSNDSNIQYKTHPNVDKKLFSNGIIALRDPSRPFPVGQPLGILKWRFATKDDSLMPLAINCWPSPSGNGSCDVNIEYELQKEDMELHDIVISIPFPGNQPPTIGEVGEGSYTINKPKHLIQWQLPLIDASTSSGMMEFTVASEDVGGFFPISVSFSSTHTFCPVNVVEISNAKDGGVVGYSREVMLSTEDYSVI